MAYSSDGRADRIPDKVDMRRYLWPVDSLGDIYAAAASAAVPAIEYHCNRINEPPTNLSTLFIHYNARRLTGEVATNRGTTLSGALKAIATFGVCKEATWPFDPKALGKEPSQGAYEEAKKFAGISYYWIDDACQSLALYYPVPFVACIPRRVLTEAGKGGVMPPLTEEEIRNAKTHPAHGMTLVGYDTTARTFIARNCWGEAWGNKGHCTISFDAMQVFCPAGSQRLWVITTPEAAKDSGRGSADQTSATADVGADSTRAADLARKMREEIRSGLDKDLSDAKKRIADMLKKPGNR